MKTYVFIVLAIWGTYYYTTRYVEFGDTLALVKKNAYSAWALAVDYYVGLAYHQRADYPKCQVAFTQLLTDFPTSYYVPNSLFRQEDCAEYNADWETAKIAAARYIDENPNGQYGQIMKSRLEMLKYHHP
jgi:hypothetical protein